jgi:hypothetical protein
MPLVTRQRPFRLDTIHPSVLGDTHSAWFGRKWVGTRRERVLFNRAKWGGALIRCIGQPLGGRTLGPVHWVGLWVGVLVPKLRSVNKSKRHCELGGK